MGKVLPGVWTVQSDSCCFDYLVFEWFWCDECLAKFLKGTGVTHLCFTSYLSDKDVVHALSWLMIKQYLRDASFVLLCLWAVLAWRISYLLWYWVAHGVLERYCYVLPRAWAVWRRPNQRRRGEWRRRTVPGTMWPRSPGTSPRKSRTRRT